MKYHSINTEKKFKCSGILENPCTDQACCKIKKITDTSTAAVIPTLLELQCSPLVPQ